MIDVVDELVLSKLLDRVSDAELPFVSLADFLATHIEYLSYFKD